MRLFVLRDILSLCKREQKKNINIKYLWNIVGLKRYQNVTHVQSAIKKKI